MSNPIDLSAQPMSSRPPRRPSSNKRMSTRLEDTARSIWLFAALISVLLLVYLLIGLLGGAWANPAYKGLAHADRVRNLGNIALVFRVLQASTLVTLVALLIVTYRDEGIGYVMLALGALFYAGIPFITAQVYSVRGFTPSQASGLVLTGLQSLSWLFTVPGIVWMLYDLYRRFQSAAEIAAINRASTKYGANVEKQVQTKQKQRFLGKCWELPYCREMIREKCPIFIRRKGPCWHYKEGCMCEERIILQAVIATDWKQRAARANTEYNIAQQAAKSRLTPADKRERCRNCIIYNEHERQKYKALTTAAVVGLPILAILNGSWLQKAVSTIMASLEYVMERFSFGDSGGGISFLHGRPSAAIEWILIGALVLIIMSQVLRLIEFVCFKIKI